MPPRRASRIHRGLTGARDLIGTRYLADPELRREYAAEIAPRTGAALRKILAEVYGAARVPPGRALDLGAGTGAAGAALRERFGAGLEVVSVDRVAAPGVLAADLERGVPAGLGRFDLIVTAHLLGELFLADKDERRLDALARRVLAWTRELLAAGGLVVIVEPALRETSRALLGVRDRLLAAGLAVVAPCFWTGPCPALERERDWCHDAASSRDRGPPPPPPAASPRLRRAPLVSTSATSCCGPRPRSGPRRFGSSAIASSRRVGSRSSRAGPRAAIRSCASTARPRPRTPPSGGSIAATS
jgi:SAM-dependent methyltransferase